MKNGNTALGGLIWKFLERSSYQIINFLVTLVLARLLTPEEYGLVALVLTLITILQVFVDSGMGTALVQRKEIHEEDYGTVFVANVILSIFLYILAFFCAPAVSKFYGENLNLIIRILAVIILIFGIKNIYQAYISRNMLFKNTFFISFLSICISGLLGIVLAYFKFGIWVLVCQQLTNEIICTLLYILIIKWRPQIIFSKDSFFQSFGYGWKLLISSLIDAVYNNVRQLLIGKYYSSGDLAYYSKGEQFPNALVGNINTSMNVVLLPVMSQKQDDRFEVKKIARTMIRVSSYILWPMMIGLFVVANKIILILLGEKWISTVPYLQIFCLVYALQPLQTTNLSVMKAMGRSDLFLKMEIIKKSIGLILVIVSVKFGALYICFSSFIYSIVASIINSFPNRKIINYSYFEQIKDIIPFIVLSAIMGGVVHIVGTLKGNIYIILFIQIIVGLVVYLLLSVVFKVDCLQYILEFIKGKVKANE